MGEVLIILFMFSNWSILISFLFKLGLISVSMNILLLEEMMKLLVFLLVVVMFFWSSMFHSIETPMLLFMFALSSLLFWLDLIELFKLLQGDGF